MHTPCSILLSLLLVAAARGAAPSTEEVLAATKQRGGLAVHIGTTDGALESALAANGRWLVHGLAGNPDHLRVARQALARKGMYGLVSIELKRSFAELPYADNLVNLLIADIDSLGDAAPSEKELMRVIAPGGVAYLRRGSAWRAATKPRPAAMDEWTHFDHGADGNGVSRDKLVRQPNFVQWICGVQPIKLGGNPAGFINLTGIRVAGGRAVFDWSAEDRRNRVSNLACRDAFSGAPLWTVEREYEAGRKRWQLVADGDRIYTAMKRKAPLVSLDAATGEVVTTFAAAGEASAERDENNQVRITQGKLITNVGDTLYALDAASGALLWKHTEAGARLMFPSASAEANRVFVTVCPADALARSRWPSAVSDAVLCLDLASGKTIWRNDEVKGKPIGQLVYHNGILALFAGSAIGGRGEKEGGGWLGCITVEDGKLRGQTTFSVKWNTSMYNAVVRDGGVYFAGHTQVFRTDPMTGQTEAKFTIGYNQRCNRFCATDDLFITGYVTYLDRDFNGTLQSAARAGCALGATPANGMIYFTPSACGCFTQLRGYMAMSPEPVREAIREEDRLEKLSVKEELIERANDAPPAVRGPIARDWSHSERTPAPETTAAALPNGHNVRAIVHEHRIEARDEAGKVVWSFTCDGRVSQTPLVHGDKVFAGCHDGYVYALRAADGLPLWRYFVAPYHRKMMAYGQLESSWPVYGVTVHQGLICASAGLHPEVGGGVYVVGLDPATGEAKRRLRLAKRPAQITTTAGKASGTIVPHSFVNEVLATEGDLLKLPAFRTEGFAFSLDESEEAISRRLETPPAKKK